MHQLTRCTSLALNATHPPSVQRMPAISDHNILPDMGRMTARFALNRKNSLFAGHDAGAVNWACLASLIETCKLNGVDPQAYLADVLTKLVNLCPRRGWTIFCRGRGGAMA